MRYSELNHVKRELEKSLRQVKDQMMEEAGSTSRLEGGDITERSETEDTTCTFSTFSNPPSMRLMRPAINGDATKRHRLHQRPSWASKTAGARYKAVVRRPRVNCPEEALPIPAPEEFEGTINDKHWTTMYRKNFKKPGPRPMSSQGARPKEVDPFAVGPKDYTKLLDRSLREAFSARGRRGVFNQERRGSALMRPFGERPISDMGQVTMARSSGAGLQASLGSTVKSPLLASPDVS